MQSDERDSKMLKSSIATALGLSLCGPLALAQNARFDGAPGKASAESEAVENAAATRNGKDKQEGNCAMDRRETAKVIMAPSEKHSERLRFWQGCPSVASTPKGRLFAAWYSGGTGEPSPDQYNLLIKSDDGGKTWTDPLLVVDSLQESRIRAIDIQLWLDPEKRLWLFWTQRDDKIKDKEPGHLSVFAIVCENPDAAALSWSEPRYLSEGFLRCQPTALSDGRYVLCAYDWLSNRYSYSESLDKGSTWLRRSGGAKLKTDFDETMVFERRDKSLWMLARAIGGEIGESVSCDGGKTWSDGRPSAISAPNSRFFIGRLPSGRTLLVHNANPGKRKDMTASLSEDDGKTWTASLLLDSDDGVSYPDVSFAPDGSIYVVYDHGRQSFKEIVLAKIAEEDILNGKAASKGSFLKRIISKAPEKPYDQELFNKEKARDKAFLEECGKFNGWSP